MSETKDLVEKGDWVVKQSEEIMRLMKEGKSVEEALRLTQHMIPKTIGDRIEYIKGLNSISEVRKALHGANSKLSKSRGKPSEARYMEEIKTAKDKLNELMARVQKESDPLKAALNLGEAPSGIVQLIVIEEEATAKDLLDRVKKELKWTNKILKTKINEQPTATPKVMTDKLDKISSTVREIYEGRVKNNDQRVVTLNRRLGLLEELKKQAQGKQTEKAEKVERKARLVAKEK